VLRYLEKEISLELNGDRCIGCGRCLEVCPHGVFTPEGPGKVRIRDRGACMECGACSTNCPVEAIRVRRGVGCADALLNQWLETLRLFVKK